MNSRFFRIACFVALVLGQSAPAQDDEVYGPKPTAAPKAKAQYEARLKVHEGDASKLVLPGLLADREARTVEVLAESTGLEGDAVAEFLLIDQGSSHGYEALLWSFAKPGDVHRALEFIGLKPGTPVNPRMLRFWADGDPVALNVRVDGETETVPIERLIVDKETGETLPEEGFIFAGSLMVPPRNGKSDAQYAADVYDPKSVASIYNEPAAVLDVPRQVSQNEVYGRQVVNPEGAFDHGTLLTIVMTPGRTDGRPRAPQLRLSLGHAAGSTGMVCRLVEEGGKVLENAATLTSTLERLVAQRDDGAPPYVDLSFADVLTVAQVTKTCVLMAMAEAMGMARINPPAAGRPYYRAFVPDKRWLKPDGRPSQPWELHLAASEGRVSGELVWHEPVWSADSIEPTFKRRSFAVPSPDAMRAKLNAGVQDSDEGGAVPSPGVLLVYAPGTMRYGEVMAFLRPVLGTHGTVYVFGEGE